MVWSSWEKTGGLEWKGWAAASPSLLPTCQRIGRSVNFCENLCPFCRVGILLVVLPEPAMLPFLESTLYMVDVTFRWEAWTMLYLSSRGYAGLQYILSLLGHPDVFLCPFLMQCKQNKEGCDGKNVAFLDQLEVRSSFTGSVTFNKLPLFWSAVCSSLKWAQ